MVGKSDIPVTQIERMRREFEQVVIGPIIYRRVEKVVDRLLNKRDPRIYAGGAGNAKTELSAIVSEFVTDVLLAETGPQLVYIIDHAESLSHFDALLARQARKFIAGQRVRDVPSNMVKRALKRLREPPFVVVHEAGIRTRFGLYGRTYPGLAGHTSAEVRRAVAAAALVPKVRITAEERLPRMYDERGLVAVLTILLENSANSVAVEELDLFFNELLTAWQSSLLTEVDERVTPSRKPSPESEQIIDDTVSIILDSLDVEEQQVLLGFLSGTPDATLGQQLNIKRTTVIARRQKITERLQTYFDDLSEDEGLEVLRRLGSAMSLARVNDHDF